jgi:hypothetical protein
MLGTTTTAAPDVSEMMAAGLSRPISARKARVTRKVPLMLTS